MRWTVSLCRTNDDTADSGTTVLAIETQHGRFVTDTLLLTYDKKKKTPSILTLYVLAALLCKSELSILFTSCSSVSKHFTALKLRNNSVSEAIYSSVVTLGHDGSWRLHSSENDRTDGNEIEYGYPITCGDSRAVLLYKKFVCPGINVRCVKVSWSPPPCF